MIGVSIVRIRPSPTGGSPDALESQLVSAFRAATLPDAETLDLRQPPSPLSPGLDPHGQQHHHHHHHHHQAAPPLSHADYSRKRAHRHVSDLPGFFPGGHGGDLGGPGSKKAKFSAAAAAAAAANYYDNAYLSFEKSLRGAFGTAGSEGLDGPGGLGVVGLDPYGGGGGAGGGAVGGGHHLLSPINYTLTAEAINRRIRSTLGLDDPMDSLGKGSPTEGEVCCQGGGGGQGVPSPDWLVGRRPALADTRPYTHSPIPPASAYEEHKFSPFSPAGNAPTLHDDNNNVDKKTFTE
ncbi:hypothetical protein ZHAS_00004765 [Anopheles sinensis]|uniref:Uncharacterized protein n=1 Tax=Anopheles sinensis TaxID=74873 RepID=A0A084VHU1_ANOSI|nr:hypothetical protein ZHAS_00004765 [Anopheles sinensis]